MRIKFGKIKEFLEKLPRIIAEHFFLAFLVLVFFALIFGGILVFKSIILIEKLEPEITEKAVQFRESTYQKILTEWENRQKRFEETEKKEYPDPFLKVYLEEELTE